MAELGAKNLTRVMRQEIIQKAKIEVTFNDLPRGARVTTDKDPGLTLDLNLGHVMEAP
jgi:hypothetical protein